MKKKIRALTDHEAKELEKLCNKLDKIYDKNTNWDVLYCGAIAAIANQCTNLKNKKIKSFAKKVAKDLKKTIKSMKKLKTKGEL